MYKPYDELMKRKGQVVIWGTGKNMLRYISKIDPSINLIFFADTYVHKWGTYPAKNINSAFMNKICKSKDEIRKENIVLIAMDDVQNIEIVSKELDEKGIDYCYMIDAVNAYMPKYDAIYIEKFYKKYDNIQTENDDMKINYYINCHVPYTYCNLKCSYCYIWKFREFKYKRNYFHSPKFIRAALSKKRLGGVALINFCAAGETLLCKELIPIIKEITDEGHFVSVVTNGTITEAFNKLLTTDINMDQIFIKFSFHYQELKRLNLLHVFVNNVIRMRVAGCSVTVEITPSDELIPYIDDIKEFSMKEFGALPHVTVARDNASKDLRILSDYSNEAYRDIWGTFESALFEFKMDQIYIKRIEDCMAGEWSFAVDLENGNMNKCLFSSYLDNIYNDILQPLKFEKVGCNCILPYCYNSHAYLTLGIIEKIKAPTYFSVRDRYTRDGLHWVHGKMKDIFEQKLYENNKNKY